MRRFFPIAACFVFAAVAGHADEVGHDQALRLVKKGTILPLADIAAKVQEKAPGKVLEVELESEDGGYVYEFKILRKNGRVQEVEADAATGKILKVEDDD